MKSIVLVVAISASQLLVTSQAIAAGAPSQAPIAKAVPAASAPAAAAKKHQPPVKPVDINSASKAQLAKLPGLSAADAQRVIAGRPYLTKAHLVTHKVISEAQYRGIEGQIYASQGRAARVAGGAR